MTPPPPGAQNVGQPLYGKLLEAMRREDHIEVLTLIEARANINVKNKVRDGARASVASPSLVLFSLELGDTQVHRIEGP